jgi:hypothetical protein
MVARAMTNSCVAADLDLDDPALSLGRVRRPFAA